MRAKQILVVLLALIGPVLASCSSDGPFVSNTPLITADEAEANYSFIVFRYPKNLAFPDLPEDAVVLVRNGTTYDDSDRRIMFIPVGDDIYIGQMEMYPKDLPEDRPFRYIYFGIQLLPDERVAHIYKLLSVGADIVPGIRRCSEMFVCVDSLDAYAGRIRVEMQFAPQMTLTHLTLFH